MAVRIKRPKPLFIIILLIFLLLIVGLFTSIYLTGPVDRNSSEKIEVEISSNTSTLEIGKILEEKELIRSKYLFVIYVKMNSGKSLKASTYFLNKSMNLTEIVRSLENGSDYNPNLVKITFKEGQRITDYARVISDNTNNSYDEVINMFKDYNYINTLISKYWFLSETILSPGIYYPLEGYLFPATYEFKSKDVTINEIIEKVLDNTDKRLSEYKDTLINNVHYYMTMASIVELEGTNTDNRKMIVGVFNNRINKGMNLGSDVTTYYGLQAAMNSDLTKEQFASINAYNTRAITMGGKMPIGPICNPSISSIEASIAPTVNDYLFFVADKHGNIFYTRTNSEHDQKVAEIKAKGDWIWQN